MTIQRNRFLVGVPGLLLLAAAMPVSAALQYQCPDPLLTQNTDTGACGGVCTFDPKTPSNSTDPNCQDPGAPAFDNCKVQIDPVTGQPSGATTDPAVVCRAITCGDGHINMADGNDIYIFGFSDVTNVAQNEIEVRGNPTDSSGYPLGGANFSAPTLFAKEGQDLYLTLTNTGFRERPDLFDPHTVHYHGFPNAASQFDGEPTASFGINLGSSLTYFYRNEFPGTYMWHCHVEAAEHMQMGMLGNLYILPAQDGTFVVDVINGMTYSTFAYDDCPTPNLNLCGTTGYNVMYFLQETGFDPVFHNADGSYNKISFSDMDDTYLLLNGRGYPDTVNPDPIMNQNGNPSQPMPAIPMTIVAGTRQPATIAAGQRVLIHLSSLNTVDFSTLRVLGIPMRIVGQGAQLLRGPTGVNTSYATSLRHPRGRGRGGRAARHHRRRTGDLFHLHHESQPSQQRRRRFRGHDDRDRRIASTSVK